MMISPMDVDLVSAGLPPDNLAHLEKPQRHKRDDSVWQEDRHRHRCPRVAQNLALTRNALPAIIPFDEKHNFPSLIAHYQQNPQIAIDLLSQTPPQI